MKKKYIALLLTALVATAAVVGTSLATEFDNPLITRLNISQRSLSTGIVGGMQESISVVPGKVTELNYAVKNDGSKDSYDIYAKVTVNYSWEQEEGADEISADDEVVFFNYDEDAALEKVMSYEEQKVLDNGWILAYHNNGQIVMYYTKPIGVGENSVDFIKEMEFATDMDNAYAGATFKLDVIVNAVQANSAEDAIAAEWGVFPIFAKDGSGTITAVSETRGN